MIPLGAILFATTVELSLRPSTGDRAALLVLLSSIWAVAWAFGWRSGLIATTASVFAALYFVVPPVYSFRVTRFSDGVQVAVLGIQGILLSAFCEVRRRAVVARVEAEGRERNAMAEADAANRQLARLKLEFARARTDWLRVSDAIARELHAKLEEIVAESGAGQAKQGCFLGAVQNDSRRALAYVEQLMAYNKVCESEPGSAIVNSGELWDDAAISYRQKWGIPVVLQRPERLPDIRANPDILARLFEMMIEAAQPFAPAGEPVELFVAVGEMPGEWTFSVSDSGAVNAADQNRNFPEYIQNADGNVLRAAVARRLIDSQGGRLWNAGRLGGGTSSVFSMPRVK